MAALELPADNVASIADLDLELSIVASRLEDGLIFHQVPLVLVRIVCTTILFQEAWVKLEATHFVKHWAYVLVGKLVDVELVIEVPVPEHEVFPEIDVLAKKLGMLLATLILDERRVEESLRDLDVVGVLGHLRQSSESLSSEWTRASLAIVRKPEVRNARDQPEEGFLRANRLLN